MVRTTVHILNLNTGHIPDCLDPDFEEYFALGPISRYAEDLSLLLKILKQPGSPDVPFDKPVRYFIESITNDKIRIKTALSKFKLLLPTVFININVR